MSPSKRVHKELPYPWHARRKRDDLEYSLGYFSTREEAAEVEARFDAEWPSRRGQHGK